MAHKKEPEAQYFNRELSWLAFDRRVLGLCMEPTFPVLERMRFLAIACNNLDEFFEIRVAGLEQQLESGVLEVGFDGMGPREQLRRISVATTGLMAEADRCWAEEIIPALAKEKIFYKTLPQCTADEKAWLKKYFEENIAPALTPLSVDPAHPFPHLRNKGVYVILSIADPNIKRAPSEIAIVPVPPILSRIIRIENGKENEFHIAILGEVVKYFAGEMFPGYKVRNSALFRITRNSDLYFDEEETENLLQTIENELHNRRKGAAVRLEVEDSINETMLKTLVDALDLDTSFIFRKTASPLNLARLLAVFDFIDRPDLKFPPFKPYVPEEFKQADNIFSVIRQKDRLLHHPYDSFLPVEEFVSQAAKDPDVLAIKLTLYRTGKKSPILKSLKEAATNGKQVTVLVELKARFDEENNIQWARELEERGVHVLYGMVGYKTHCKTGLVIRKEENGALRKYVHLGTGNYNSQTARFYTDLSYFTANEEITDEIANLFNTLTGKVAKPAFSKLWIAPFNFHSNFIAKVKREAANAKAGKPARIIVKANSLIEPSSIDALYEASQAGVKIDLIVRGICGLVPGVKDLSQNINVRSIVGTFLEHSRIYYFENGGNPEVFAGSGDIMQRNMFKRIECIYPIEDPDLKKRVTDEILPTLLKDNYFASILHSNGAYYKSPEMKKQKPFSAQSHFMELSNEKNAAADPVKMD